MNSSFLHEKEAEGTSAPSARTLSTELQRDQSIVQSSSAGIGMNLCKLRDVKHGGIEGNGMLPVDCNGIDRHCPSRSSSWPSPQEKRKMRTSSVQNRINAKHSLARDYVTFRHPFLFDKKQPHQDRHPLRQSAGCFANHGRKACQGANAASSHCAHASHRSADAIQLYPEMARSVQESGVRRAHNIFWGCAACMSYQDEEPELSLFGAKENINERNKELGDGCSPSDIGRGCRDFGKPRASFENSVVGHRERRRAENSNPNQKLNANNFFQDFRYVKTPPELSKRIVVLEKQVKKDGIWVSSPSVCFLSAEIEKPDRKHEASWLPDENVVYQLGYPTQDNDIDEYFNDGQGLSSGSAEVLKTELLRHLRETRGRLVACAREMQLILLRQSRFRVVFDYEILESVSFVVQRFISARKQTVEKFRVYARTRRWIESVHNRRRKGFLSNRQSNILRLWLFSNFHDPYPNSEDRKKLTSATQLDAKQINNWLINARSRIWKPTVECISTKGKRKGSGYVSNRYSGSEGKRRRIRFEKCPNQAHDVYELPIDDPSRSIPQKRKQ